MRDNRKLFIYSSEYDFLKNPLAIRSFKIIKKGISKVMIADLETPINIWYDKKLNVYQRVMLKPRYMFQSFRRLEKGKTLTVNIASFNNDQANKFIESNFKIIGIAELYYS